MIKIKVTELLQKEDDEKYVQKIKKVYLFNILIFVSSYKTTATMVISQFEEDNSKQKKVGL